MSAYRRVLAAPAALCLCLAAAGCGLAPQGGMAERCAHLMRAAYPGADIDITKQAAAAAGLTTVVAHVEGDRTNLPPNSAIAHHLAVECKFDNSVLTGFRWTKGPN